MPQLDLPLDAPWWAVWILLLLVVISYSVARVAKAVLPPAEDRLEWWRSFWRRRRDRQGGEDQGDLMR